ncbi:MAG TPA: sulfotransferase [Terriglobia bacterium]|nr:sulfotransferase [Terriglobia bacterium]
MINPYLFIVGCPRSGTTLLKRMVDAHPKIAMIEESHWIPRMHHKRKLTPGNLVTRELLSQLLENPRFVALGIGHDELVKLAGNGQPVPYSEFVTRIFDFCGRTHGKEFVGDKTPDHVRWLDTLHALWPAARVVHLIRDGRDVCLSIANWPKGQRKNPGTFPTWKEDPVSTTALWWELNVRLGRQFAGSLGPERYYEMRYESLVSHPETECAALCSFLGLQYHDAMLRFHEGKTQTGPGLSSKDAWLPVTPGLRDWKSQMSREDIQRFEAEAGTLLDELGYSRDLPEPGQQLLENASRIRESFTRDPRWFRF